MVRRRWAAAVSVVVVALVIATLGPCADSQDAPETGTAVSPPSQNDSELASAHLRRAAAAEEPKEPASQAQTPAANARASAIVRVVEFETKRPIPGASVLLTEEDDTEHRGIADDAGVARFSGLAPGYIAARASGDEWVRSDWTGRTAEPGGEVSLDVELEGGVLLEGVVIDAAGDRPLAGAAVEVILGGSIPGIGGSSTSAPALGHLTTGADGRFRLRVPQDEMVTPTASASGFVPSGRTVIVPEGDARRPPVELRLDRGGALRGTVRDPDGRPAAGVRVYAVPADQPSLLANPDGAVTGSGRRWAALRASTDADGRYELDGLAFGGMYVGLARADGFAESARQPGLVVTAAAPSAQADFALRRYGSLVIRVVGPDGSPRSAEVVVATTDGERLPTKETGENGTLVLEGLDPGGYRIDVAPSKAPPETATADVAENPRTELVVKVEQGVNAAGIVVDDRGEPVAGAIVHLWRPPGRLGQGLAPSKAHAYSGADGRFLVEGLRTGRHVVTVFADHHVSLAEIPAETPARDLRLVVTRQASVTLRLVLPAGAEKPESLEVYRDMLDRASGGEAWREGNGGSEDFGDGRLVVGDFMPGTCRIRVVAPEFAEVVRRFDAAPGAMVDLGDVPLDAGIDVVGRVEDLAGAPVAGARASVGNAFESGFRNAVSGADGTFRLAHLPAGKSAVAVESKGYMPARIDFDARAGASLIIRMARGALLRVSAVDAEGAPVASAPVEVRPIGAAPTSDPTISRAADHRGAFEARIAAGKYRVTVHGKEAASDVELAEGGDVSVRLVVR